MQFVFIVSQVEGYQIVAADRLLLPHVKLF